MASAEIPQIPNTPDTALPIAGSGQSTASTKAYRIYNGTGTRAQTFTEEQFDSQFAGTPSGDLGLSSGSMSVLLARGVEPTCIKDMAELVCELKPDDKFPVANAIERMRSDALHRCGHCQTLRALSQLHLGTISNFGDEILNPTAHFCPSNVLMKCDQDHVQPVPYWSTRIPSSDLRNPNATISLEQGVRSKNWDCAGCGEPTNMSVLNDHSLPNGYFTNMASTHDHASDTESEHDTAASNTDATATAVGDNPTHAYGQGDTQDGNPGGANA
ncbi:hypothetical protein I302_100535 [Kwoniella bestiolae CBS 10118]|uniref:Uncharacterized protein n=1 Tax=Kwoniella bestiolae CBS 10118 TaxID=1296100 RepID=A0A1B9G5E3_9TREE|nr:hypothetical protein I302_03909 [Kwoniella bestiolae CBS 10118]OCF26230.1 hypothetical protein I302_03909 [Kwoniella bestiolae CBS 10118]